MHQITMKYLMIILLLGLLGWMAAATEQNVEFPVDQQPLNINEIAGMDILKIIITYLFPESWKEYMCVNKNFHQKLTTLLTKPDVQTVLLNQYAHLLAKKDGTITPFDLWDYATFLSPRRALNSVVTTSLHIPLIILSGGEHMPIVHRPNKKSASPVKISTASEKNGSNDAIIVFNAMEFDDEKELHHEMHKNMESMVLANQPKFQSTLHEYTLFSNSKSYHEYRVAEWIADGGAKLMLPLVFDPLHSLVFIYPVNPKYRLHLQIPNMLLFTNAEDDMTVLHISGLKCIECKKAMNRFNHSFTQLVFVTKFKDEIHPVTITLNFIENGLLTNVDMYSHLNNHQLDNPPLSFENNKTEAKASKLCIRLLRKDKLVPLTYSKLFTSTEIFAFFQSPFINNDKNNQVRPKSYKINTIYCSHHHRDPKICHPSCWNSPRYSVIYAKKLRKKQQQVHKSSNN